jgi:hypothetical protein
LRGFQYDPAGQLMIDFNSQHVAFEQVPFHIEFVWQAEKHKDQDLFHGYTQMVPDDSTNIENLEGNGFFITFHHIPQRFGLHFIKLSQHRLLKEYNLGAPPVTEQERKSFVKKLHETWKNFTN